MLEIILLFKLCGRIGNTVRGKGRSPIRYQLMTILFWFCGEIAGGVIADVVLAIIFDEHYPFVAYVAAIAGAALGAWLAFRLVAGLPDPVESTCDDAK